MENKHSFWTLVNTYDKIEIPILQRDYAQGRTDVKRIRMNFTKYLSDSLLTNTPVELDFVYGSIKEKSSGQGKVFIPLDGQQRLTTLFILHWYLSARENRLDEVKDKLKRFTYETRPSAHDFCEKLISCKYSDNLKADICDAVWFNDEWLNDPTVEGMLEMIKTFQQNKDLNGNVQDSLLDKLIDEKNPVITFYFIPLERFGLTEDLYIRMNARGKMLNNFEKFKSEFYKIIKDSDELVAQFRDKIEYDWVETLWNFREEDKYIVDSAFMNYLRFITEMLYFKQLDPKVEDYESFDEDELDYEVLKDVFRREENLKFLIFALDNIAQLQVRKQEIFWEKENNSLGIVLERIISGDSNSDNTYEITLYAALRYLFVKAQNINEDDFIDYVRVIRNLLYNTQDKSRREWTKLFKSIEKLITDQNIYLTLTEANADSLMEGFRVSQREEEIFKARIIVHNPPAKYNLQESEDNVNLRGNIRGLIRASYTNANDKVKDIKMKECNPEDFRKDKLTGILNCYSELSKKDFDYVRGDFINTSLYNLDQWRLKWDGNYKHHDTVFQVALDFYKKKEEEEGSNMSVEEFVIYKEKRFIQKLINEGRLSVDNRKIREQLYLYYILTVRIMKLDVSDFFKNGQNFGWLQKAKKFASIFNGIEDIEEYKTKQPIFQTYKSHFRYSLGLRPENALPPEIVGGGRIQNPFDRLKEWSKEE
jgi:hypothetical protein